MHHVEQLNKSFGFDCSNLSVETSLNEEEEASKIIHNNNKYVVIFPGGNWKPKIWPITKYNTLIKKLSLNNKKVKFLLVGSDLEKNIYYSELVKEINGELIIDLFGKSLTLTAAYMKRCNLFVGNDSGLMHLAAACKLPTIGLFGPTNDIVYSPWGKNNIVIRTKEDYNSFKNITKNRNISYMNSISVNDVYNKIISTGFL